MAPKATRPCRRIDRPLHTHGDSQLTLSDAVPQLSMHRATISKYDMRCTYADLHTYTGMQYMQTRCTSRHGEQLASMLRAARPDDDAARRLHRPRGGRTGVVGLERGTLRPTTVCAQRVGLIHGRSPLGVSISETWRFCFLPYLAHASPTGSGSARLSIDTLVAL